METSFRRDHAPRSGSCSPRSRTPTSGGSRTSGGIADAGSVSDGHRALIHILEGALTSHFESDPLHSDFRRIVTPTRKMTGDNPDAVYFEAPVDPTRVYRVRGNVAGAVYTSITVEAGAEEGKYATRTAGVINDTQFDIDADGQLRDHARGPVAVGQLARADHPTAPG